MKFRSLLLFRPTLERKFIALASLIILVCSFIANIIIVNVYRNQLFAEAEKRALLLAKSTAISFTNTLLYQSLGLVEEGGLIENYITDLISDPRTAVTGVTVFDPRGEIIATDDYERYFTPPSADSVARWGAVETPRILTSDEGEAFVVLYPMKVSSRRFGTLEIRFTRQPEMERAIEFKHWMLTVTLAFAVLGVFLAFIVARTLAKPIKELAAEMTRVRAPDYVAALRAERRDEIGDLERSFIDMLSRLKEAAEERERQQRALIQTEKLASVGTLVAGLAHEINNPLAGIRNCLRRIQGRPEDTSQTEKYAKLMDDALARIEKIVRDLLDFSRKKDLLLKPTDLNEVIRAAAELVHLQLKKRKVTIELNLHPELPPIPGDRQHLQQVFLNLLLNAVDATPEGGTISVETLVEDNSVVAAVRDTGRGIAPEIRDKIFDPFFTTKPVGKGTGLGLSVSKAIVEGHQGSIAVESDVNGTIFRVRFPQGDGSHERTAPTQTVTEQTRLIGHENSHR